MLHDQSDLPPRLLQTTENLLNGNVASEETFALSDTYYHVIGHAAHDLPWSSAFVAKAVSKAFSTADGFHPFYRMKSDYRLVIQENKEYESIQATEWGDETLAFTSVGDVAPSAAFAYACVEHRNILFRQFGNVSQQIRNRLMDFGFPPPLDSPHYRMWESWGLLERKLLLGVPTFNSNKLLEFWEWWLTEAIPQAWEKAHSPTIPPSSNP